MNDERPAVDSPPVSKSQRKRQARALFELGRELVGLDAAILERLTLPEPLRDAVLGAREITSHIARKRQLQYIGGLLRKMDVRPVREALDGLRAEARQQTARHHRVEAWRDQLLAEGDQALSVLADNHPLTDVQALRQLMRNASREAELGKPPSAARKLFRLLREIDTGHPLPPL